MRDSRTTSDTTLINSFLSLLPGTFIIMIRLFLSWDSLFASLFPMEVCLTSYTCKSLVSLSRKQWLHFWVISQRITAWIKKSSFVDVYLILRFSRRDILWPAFLTGGCDFPFETLVTVVAILDSDIRNANHDDNRVLLFQVHHRLHLIYLSWKGSAISEVLRWLQRPSNDSWHGW